MPVSTRLSLTGLFKALLLAAVVIACASPGRAVADDAKIDVTALIQDTQKTGRDEGRLAIIWWIPEEFWRASFAQRQTMNAGQLEEFLKVTRRYTMIIAVDGKIGPMGGVTYKSADAIRVGLQVKDASGNFYRPIGEDKMDPDIKTFLGMMKPMFANLLGPMGENMQIFLFPAVDGKGVKVADAVSEGGFTVQLGVREFKWRLPLGSCVAPKVCPKCGERLSGAYRFCPYDGTKLVEYKPDGK